MRLSVFIFIFSLCQFGAFAQKKGNLPPKPQQMPDKDPVAAISDIAPGKSKVFNWHRSDVVFTISGVKSTFCVFVKGKAAAKIYPVNKKRNDINVKLAKGDNMFVLRPRQKEDEKVHIRMTDKEMQHEVTARLSEGMNDTIIIKRH